MTSTTRGMIKNHVSIAAGTLPTAGTVILDGTTGKVPVTPLNSDGTLSVDFVPSIAGVLTITYTGSTGTVTTAKAYGGSSLTAGVLYPLEIKTLTGEVINFTFSATPGTYRLIVREV